MKRLLTTAALCLPLGFTAAQAAGPTVKEIDVTVELASIENPQAAEYWGNLETDLEAAILARMTDQIADDGANILIDVEEVELSNVFQEALGVADTRIKANVTQTHDADNSRFEAYELTVDVDQAIPFMPEGTDMTLVTRDTPEFYTAMVSAFADAVAKRVK